VGSGVLVGAGVSVTVGGDVLVGAGVSVMVGGDVLVGAGVSVEVGSGVAVVVAVAKTAVGVSTGGVTVGGWVVVMASLLINTLFWGAPVVALAVGVVLVMLLNAVVVTTMAVFSALVLVNVAVVTPNDGAAVAASVALARPAATFTGVFAVCGAGVGVPGGSPLD